MPGNEQVNLIRRWLNEMRLVSKSSAGNKFFCIDVAELDDHKTLKPDLGKKVVISRELRPEEKSLALQNDFFIRGYFWNHYGPSKEDLFLSAKLLRKTENREINISFNEEDEVNEVILHAFAGVANEDFDFPLGGFEIFVEQVIASRVISADNYARNTRALLNYLVADLFNFDGLR